MEARLAIGSGLYIPVHWDTFDLALHSWTEPVERAIVAAADAGVDVAVPRPGESIEPAKPPALVRWWPELPWQTMWMRQWSRASVPHVPGGLLPCPSRHPHTAAAENIPSWSG